MMIFRPAPKPSTTKDKRVIEKVKIERDGLCLYGLFENRRCLGGLHVHHIDSVGSGGEDKEDNLITLCALHHDMVHRGQISKDKLRDILEFYHKEDD